MTEGISGLLLALFQKSWFCCSSDYNVAPAPSTHAPVTAFALEKTQKQDTSFVERKPSAASNVTGVGYYKRKNESTQTIGTHPDGHWTTYKPVRDGEAMKAAGTPGLQRGASPLLHGNPEPPNARRSAPPLADLTHAQAPYDHTEPHWSYPATGRRPYPLMSSLDPEDEDLSFGSVCSTGSESESDTSEYQNVPKEDRRGKDRRYDRNVMRQRRHDSGSAEGEDMGGLSDNQTRNHLYGRPVPPRNESPVALSGGTPIGLDYGKRNEIISKPKPKAVTRPRTKIYEEIAHGAD